MIDADPLVQIDDLRVYTSHVDIAGRRRVFDEILRVEGGTVEFSVNLVPTVKHTSISILFVGGDAYQLDERRTLFGRNRHREIAKCVQLLRQLTFESRLKKFVVALAQNRRLPIGRNSNETYTLVGAVANAVSHKRPAEVYLNRDGTITNGSLALDLKRCRRDGVLELGVFRQNKSAPGQVYACYERSWFEKSTNKALKFDVLGDHDQDVVLTLLDWLAKPDSQLGGRSEDHG